MTVELNFWDYGGGVGGLQESAPKSSKLEDAFAKALQLTFAQVRALYPDPKPSERWISKQAKLTKTYRRGGKRAYVLASGVEHLIEGKQWPSGEPIASRSERNMAPSMRGSKSRKRPKTAKSPGDPLSEARELLTKPKRGRS